MITYPVAPESRWATWSIAQAIILKHNKPWPRADGTEIVGLDPDIVPLLEVQEAQPVFDPATHYLTRSDGVVDVPANTHTHGWIIVPRTQEDLDAEAEREQAQAQYALLKAHSGTAEERMVRMENVAAYNLKSLVGTP